MLSDAQGRRFRGVLSRRSFIELGLQGLLSASLAAGCGKRRALLERKPNIVLITLDTTRADHLSSYGYTRPASRNLDALAGESLVYTSAVSPSSWTLPAHASLFTGKFTSSHGARKDPEGPLILSDAIKGPESWNQHRARGLSTTAITLAQLLKGAGYATGGVVAGPWMMKVFGLHQGFDYYDDDEISSLNGRIAPRVTARAIEWIEEHQDRPFFLFLNYFDPHTPYDPPPNESTRRFLRANTELDELVARIATVPEEAVPDEDRWNLINALYDAEIHYMDRFIGILLDKLRRLRLYDKTWLVVTSDHGELLGEHGEEGHGSDLYQEELHIPFFTKYPKGEVSPDATDLRIQLTDVMPMILERLDLPCPPDIQGAAPNVGHPVIAEVYPLPALSPKGDSQAIFDGSLKFVLKTKGSNRLFDLGKDPHESTNLVEEHPNVAEAMRSKLITYLASLPKPEAARPQSSKTIDEETQEKLERLGYL